jgi:hypothetical protein
MNKHLKAVLLYSLLTIIFTWPLLPNITTEYPSTYYGHGGDPNMYIWFMDTVAKKVAHWDFHPSQMIFYPDGMNFLAGYEAPIILTVSTPIILLTHNPILAYNLILLLAFVLTAYTCYLLILYLTNSYYSALITGFSFGFSEYMLVRGTQHLDLLFLFTVPLVVLFAFKFLEKPNKKNILYLFLAVFLTALSAWYYLVGVLIFMGLLFLFNFRKFLVAKKEYFIMAALVGLAVLVPSLPMFLNKSDTSYQYVDLLLEHRGADTLNFFIPHPYVFSATASVYSSFASPYESTSYYGFVGLVAIFVMLFLSKKINIPHRGLWLTTILIFMLIALGNHVGIFNKQIAMPFAFLHNFIPFNRLRAPNRFFVFSYLGVTVFMGYFLVYMKSLLENSRTRLILVTILFISLLVWERIFLPYPILSIPVPEFYKTLGQNKETFAIADIPFIDPGLSIYNYYQIYHEKPIVDGEYFWTAYNDRTFDFIDHNPLLLNSVTCNEEALSQNYDSSKILKELADKNIRYVVVHNFIIQDINCPEMGSFLHNFFRNQEPVFIDGEITVYSTIDKTVQ